jgi:hypothetical protein
VISRNAPTTPITLKTLCSCKSFKGVKFECLVSQSMGDLKVPVLIQLHRQKGGVTDHPWCCRRSCLLMVGDFDLAP